LGHTGRVRQDGPMQGFGTIRGQQSEAIGL